MLASPIINPITILSTWYAFPDNPMLSVWRIVLGLGVALLVALSFDFGLQPIYFESKNTTES